MNKLPTSSNGKEDTMPGGQRVSTPKERGGSDVLPGALLTSCFPISSSDGCHQTIRCNAQAEGENVQREGRYHRALHGATRLARTGGRGRTRALIPTASCTIFKHQYIAAAAAAPSLLDDKRTNTSRLGCLTVTIYHWLAVGAPATVSPTALHANANKS